MSIRTVPTQPKSRSVTALGDDATVPKILIVLNTIRVGKGLSYRMQAIYYTTCQ